MSEICAIRRTPSEPAMATVYGSSRAIRSRCYPGAGAGRKSRFPGISWLPAAALRAPHRARVREDPRLLRRALGIRAPFVRARAGRDWPCRERLHARLLPPGAEPLHRGVRDEAILRDPQEPEAARAAASVHGGPRP